MALFAILIILTLVHIGMVLTGLQDSELLSMFRMDFEESLLTWFSQVILLFIPAIFAFYVGYGKKKAKVKHAKHWYFLGGVLLFLSIDDGAMIHEKFSRVAEVIGLQEVLNSVSAEWFAWSWWVLYGVAFIIIAGFFVRWFLELPRRTQVLFGIAVIIALVGQVGLEAVAGYLNASGNYDIILRGVQKLIGRGGLVVFLIALLDYIQFLPSKEKPDIKLEIS